MYQLLVSICLFFVVFAVDVPWNKDDIKVVNGKESLDLADYLPTHLDERGLITEQIWAWKKANLLANASDPYTMNFHKLNSQRQRQSSCAIEGQCDVPATRKATQMTDTVIIPCRWVVFDTAPGVSPVSDTAIFDQMASIRNDYLPFNIDIQILPGVAGITHVYDPLYAQLPAYSNTNQQWYYDIIAEKGKYAQNPTTTLNIFANSQQSGNTGTLLGIATFPWDPPSTTNTGGLWMNAVAIGGTKKTLNHEVGHNLGLWHTFHGVSEVPPCSACWENAGLENSLLGDEVGDFCADTDPTPRNYNCAPPGGYDSCNGQPWGTTSYTNIMGYGPDNCLSVLTDCQEQRMICWMCETFQNFVGC